MPVYDFDFRFQAHAPRLGATRGRPVYELQPTIPPSGAFGPESEVLSTKVALGAPGQKQQQPQNPLAMQIHFLNCRNTSAQ